MKVLAFAASNSRNSINQALVTHATSLLDAEVEIIDLNDFEMPIFSVDRESESGIPQQAKDFYQKIGEADAIVISFAEHNASYSVAYKNLYDWTSRIDMKVYQNKPSILLATSPGPGGAANVLATAKSSAPYFGMDVKADLSIASFYDQFDMEVGELTNPELKDKLASAMAQL